ncbi:MAG: hypothetical protein CME62_14990 [Halobacteriovoraceae bacterium]|nr:hypothetical protein [Halobacteriovoraceae bacterium]|tara:strand:- start:2325 stop:3071 length:747 start_codon:yes stop_codon:yes gene_type:complete
MKYLTIFLVVVIPFNLFSKEPRITRLSGKPKKIESSKKANSREKDDVISKLIENNKKINQLLRARSAKPIIWESNDRILTGKAYKGRLLNTIVSTNLASPVLVKAYPNQGLPYNTKFSCQATTRDKRVFCVCSKMITESKELVISAQLLNLDGSSGLEGLYEGNKEALIAGAVISDFSKGMLSAAQNRISTPFGSVQDNSVRNQILQGAISSADTTSDVLLEERKSSVPKITVDAGTDVIIYFMEALK